MEDSFDRLQEKMRHEMEGVFPAVLSDVKGLCSGDSVALISRSFDQRALEWERIRSKYADNLLLKNFFSDTIQALHAVKKKAYDLEQVHPSLVLGHRKLFQDVEDGITIDLLVAILVNRSFVSPTEIRKNFNIRHEAEAILSSLKTANETRDSVSPENFSLEYVLRAILKRQISLGYEGGEKSND